MNPGGKNWLIPASWTPSLRPAGDAAAPECWPGRVEPLPEDTYHAEFRCFTCGAHHNNVPTARVGEDMATRHLAEYPDHDVRAWICIVEEIAIKRPVKEGGG